MNEITVEPITVWAAFGGFVLGVLVGALVVLSEWQRDRRRWLEAMRTRQDEVKAVADEPKKLPKDDAPDMVAAIREGETEQLKQPST